MNKAKLIALSFLSLVLVACGNNQDTATEPATESVSESSVESQLESSDSAESNDAQSQDNEESQADETTEADESTADETPAADEAVFRFYVGEEQIAHFTAKDVAGKSILEVLESQDKVTFTFDQEEGIISEIEGHAIDPAEAIYWTYLLDKQFAELGVVSQTLEGGELVEWYFGTVDDIPTAIIQEDGIYEEEPVEDADTTDVDVEGDGAEEADAVDYEENEADVNAQDAGE